MTSPATTRRVWYVSSLFYASIYTEHRIAHTIEHGSPYYPSFVPVVVSPMSRGETGLAVEIL